MSKLSNSESSMLNLQCQMRQNNEELKNFLQDLDGWETDIKEKENKLLSNKSVGETKLPPVRNSLDKKKKKKVKKKSEEEPKPKQKRISSYDYRSWDKFDVDKACEGVDDGRSSSGSSSEYETDEEWEIERKKQAAVLEKDKGNDYFKRADYDTAIECYTRGAVMDPTNPLLPANRAMALIKQNKFAGAELDCSVALTLDPLYTKAYLRRGTSRMGLRKYQEAKGDYEKVLQLEPQNKKAKSDLELIEKELSKENLVSHTDPAINKEAGIVKAIFKAPHERSKKSLRRMEIEEVGLDDGAERKVAVSKVESSQSLAKQNIIEREGEMFQRFTASSPGDISMAALQGQGHLGVDEVHDGDTKTEEDNAQFCDNKMTSLKIQELNGDEESSTGVEDKKSDKISPNSSSSSPTRKKNSPRSVSKATKDIPKATSQRELSVPASSIQFQADYKVLKKDEAAFYQYFKKISSADYPKLFGQFLDAEVLTRVLTVIKDFYIPDGVEYFEVLQNLTSVKRFSMVAMFFSKKEKQVLTEILSHLQSCGNYTEDSIKSLASKYDMR